METILKVTLILHLSQNILSKPIIIINSDVTIFFSAKDDTKINEIKQMDHTDSLFKVKDTKNASEWNYAVIGKGFTTELSRNTYISKIQNFTFVTKTDVITMKGEEKSKTDYANYIMKITRSLNKIFGFLPKRPLVKLTPQEVECKPVEMPLDEPMYLLTYLEPKNEVAQKKYDWVMVSRALPVLEMEYLYKGFTDSKKWSIFDIQKYDSTRTYCEYIESKHVVRYKAKFLEAYADSKVFTAMKI